MLFSVFKNLASLSFPREKENEKESPEILSILHEIPYLSAGRNENLKHRKTISGDSFKVSVVKTSVLSDKKNEDSTCHNGIPRAKKQFWEKHQNKLSPCMFLATNFESWYLLLFGMIFNDESGADLRNISGHIPTASIESFTEKRRKTCSVICSAVIRIDLGRARIGVFRILLYSIFVSHPSRNEAETEWHQTSPTIQ